MPSNFSEYTAKKILDQILTGGTALPVYTELWVALYHNSTGTTEANLRNNTPINEIADANYARISIPLSAAATFDAAIAGTTGMDSISNSPIIFTGEADANYPNDVEYIALVDAVTAGNIIVYASITAIPVATGQHVEILATDFTVNL